MQIKIGMALGAMCCCAATAEMVDVVGGQTNVLLDTDLIAKATGLILEGASEGVITPGNLGANSVAFGITSPDSATLPTTFGYDTSDFFGTFSGTIEHRGAIFFGGSADVTLGNFTIAYDASAGFQVIDNIDLGVALFDVDIKSADPLVDTFDVIGDLLISDVFGQLLVDLGLSTNNLAGADVGDAWVQGLNQVVPAPGAIGVFMVAGVAGRRRRRA